MNDGSKQVGLGEHTNNEEIETPYVIINKTDIPFTVKRLFDREKKFTPAKSQLVNYYKLDSGQVSEYMVDYDYDHHKCGLAT